VHIQGDAEEQIEFLSFSMKNGTMVQTCYVKERLEINYFTPQLNQRFENEVMDKLKGTGLEFDFGS